MVPALEREAERALAADQATMVPVRLALEHPARRADRRDHHLGALAVRVDRHSELPAVRLLERQAAARRLELHSARGAVLLLVLPPGVRRLARLDLVHPERPEMGRADKMARAEPGRARGRHPEALAVCPVEPAKEPQAVLLPELVAGRRRSRPYLSHRVPFRHPAFPLVPRPILAQRPGAG